MLGEDQFLQLIKIAPLFSLDFILRDESEKVLLGFRRHAPAQGSWFVPGGRVYKNERIGEAVRRISVAEVGLTLMPSNLRWLGISDHIYPDNFFSDPSFGTHYIVVAVEAYIPSQAVFLGSKQQHERFQWFTEQEILNNPSVHDFTRRYFRKGAPSEGYVRFDDSIPI